MFTNFNFLNFLLKVLIGFLFVFCRKSIKKLNIISVNFYFLTIKKKNIKHILNFKTRYSAPV